MSTVLRSVPRGRSCAALLSGLVLLVSSVAAQAEMRMQQGLVRALSAEREALRQVQIVPARGDARGVSGGASAATEGRYDRAWLMSRPAPTRRDQDFVCLKEAIYHEARGETLYGQFAVAEVILNRVDSPQYPDSVCGVVHQNAHLRNACQFSYACNGRSRAMPDPQARMLAGRIADIMLSGAERELTGGATHFHATWISPSWSRTLVRTAQIGVHVFYRRAEQVSSN